MAQHAPAIIHAFTPELLADLPLPAAEHLFIKVIDASHRARLIRKYQSGKLSFMYDYRLTAGPLRGKRDSYTVGTIAGIAPTVSREARVKAYRVELKRITAEYRRIEGIVAAGGDPKEQQRQARALRQAKWEQRKLNAEARRNTLRSWIEGDYAAVLAARKSGTATRRRLLASWSNFLDEPLAEITPERIDRHQRARIDAGLSPATVDRDLAALRAALTVAVKRGLIASNPASLAAKVGGHYDHHADFRCLDEAEQRRLIAALDDSTFSPHIKPLVLLALNTGCRKGELLALRWEDVKLAGTDPCIEIPRGHTKADKSRTVPLNQSAVKALKDWRRASPTPISGWVFPSTATRGNNTGHIATIDHQWQRLCIAAQLETVRFHDLRHTFAANLARQGVALNLIGQLLGHSDLQMSLRYSRLQPQQLGSVVRALDVAGIR